MAGRSLPSITMALRFFDPMTAPGPPRFNHQGHLGALFALVHPSFAYKPSIRVEGACASGGLALVTAVKSVLSGQADVSLAIGVEVQNTVKAIYGADILAGAGHYAAERKNGHAYFFPSK